MNELLFLANSVENITPTRDFNLLYIIIDTIFVLVYLGLLIWKKRYQTVIYSLFGGILYTIVDFGGFYLASHSRVVTIDGATADAWHTFLVLLWMSMSYGITNFAFMWVLMAKDEYRKIWVFLIVMWWLIAPSISSLGGEATIQTYRTVGAYHGWMGVVMAVDYTILAAFLLYKKKPFVDIVYLFIIGFFVQFGWEFALLINGIRPMNANSFQTIIVNSCLETNLGMPTCFLIFYFVRKWRNEDMTKVVKTNVELEEKTGE